MFVSTVPDRPFEKRLAQGVKDGKQGYRESMDEFARQASSSLSSDYCQEGDGAKVYINDGNKQIPMGEDRSLFARLFGPGRGGRLDYSDVGKKKENGYSGRVVNEVVSGLPSGQNSEGSVF
jgi:hypothetical protein